MSTVPIKKPAKNELLVSELSLVLMIGASGSGKSTFAAKLVRHFKVKKIKIAFGLAESIQQLEHESEKFR